MYSFKWLRTTSVGNYAVIAKNIAVWPDLQIYFRFECRKRCTLPCIECFENSFGKPPMKNGYQTAVRNVGNDLYRLPIMDPIDGVRNLSSNKNRLHKIIWKLPNKCLEEKCDVCRRNSCCNYYGLFLFLFGVFPTKNCFV